VQREKYKSVKNKIRIKKYQEKYKMKVQFCVDPIEEDNNCTCGMTFEEEKILSPMRLVLQGYVLIGVNVFGLIANSIAMSALFTKEMRMSLFNRTLFLLACFDITFNVCDILESIRKMHYDRHSCLPMPVYQTIHLYLWPKFLYPLRHFVIIASIYTTVIIALERYLAVSKPICTFAKRDKKTWRESLTIICPVIVISLLLSFPRCFEFFIETQNFLCAAGRQIVKANMSDISYTNQTVLNNLDCTLTNISEVLVLDWNDIAIDKEYVWYYVILCYNMLTYFIPILMLFVLNYLIYIYLKRRRKSLKELGMYTSYCNKYLFPYTLIKMVESLLFLLSFIYLYLINRN
jgi:hypothetical protein